jgi:hypothetical protein
MEDFVKNLFSGENCIRLEMTMFAMELLLRHDNHDVNQLLPEDEKELSQTVEFQVVRRRDELFDFNSDPSTICSQ